MMFPVPLQPPSDGFNTLEVAFLRHMVVDMYRLIKNPEDKFILIAIGGMGYSQDIVGQMLGKSQNTVCARLQKMKALFKSHPKFAGIR